MRVQEVINKYNPKILTPFPFDEVVKDAGDLSIGITNSLPKSDIIGAIIYNKKGKGAKKFRIIVDSKLSTKEQNFAIAHELGHYFLHKDYLTSGKNAADGDLNGIIDYHNQLMLRKFSKDDTKKEKEADDFAKELLMPAPEVTKMYELTKSTEECADAFYVPLIKMAERISELRLS